MTYIQHGQCAEKCPKCGCAMWEIIDAHTLKAHWCADRRWRCPKCEPVGDCTHD